jgi:hypothetical protein
VLSELPSVTVDKHGVPRFNGRTAEERMDEFEAPIAYRLFGDGDREAAGPVRAGQREGVWRYLVRGEEQFQVSFVEDRPEAAPAGWDERDWPRTGTNSERHRENREHLELVLREYRRPEDVERIYRLMEPLTGGNPLFAVIRALMTALEVGMGDAKMAVSDACDRAGSRRF